MDCKKKEKILVVPRECSIKPYLKNGGYDFSENELRKILEDGVYGTRCLMEENFNFKQIIPYIAFISNNKVLVYKRSQKSGEQRLHEKYSLGVGGHVDLESDNNLSTYETFIRAAIREVEEEIGVKISEKDLEIKFMINDESTPVDKVHFGVGFIIKNDYDFFGGEKDILVDRKLMSLGEVNNIYDKLETWSKIFFDGVVKNLIK